MIGPILKATFLSTALTFMIVYVWSRRNTQVMMNFLGVFNFTAPYMPWVLLGFSLLLSGQLPVADLIGIGAGHAYYYLTEVYPMLYGTRLLRTPSLLSAMLNPRREPHVVLDNEEAEGRGRDSPLMEQDAAGVGPLSISDHEESKEDSSIEASLVEDFTHED